MTGSSPCVLLTGAAGFLGYWCAEELIARGARVIGLDNLSPYYDVSLKEARLARLSRHKGFRLIRADLSETSALSSLPQVDYVLHLAAQAGVRHSLNAPRDYIRDNISAHLNVLEYARATPSVKHTAYASSSSVYGANREPLFRESDTVRRPESLYAATKGACELMSRSYAALYRTPLTGLRFFTVYGPWGRPDMAPMLFLSALREGRPIRLFNRGKMRRDFTYAEDAAWGAVEALFSPPEHEEYGSYVPAEGEAVPHRVLNIGGGSPVHLMDFVTALEKAAGTKALIEYADMQPGDVESTQADVTSATETLGFSPKTGLQEGLEAFAEWYDAYREGAV